MSGVQVGTVADMQLGARRQERHHHPADLPAIHDSQGRPVRHRAIRLSGRPIRRHRAHQERRGRSSAPATRRKPKRRSTSRKWPARPPASSSASTRPPRTLNDALVDVRSILLNEQTLTNLVDDRRQSAHRLRTRSRRRGQRQRARGHQPPGLDTVRQQPRCSSPSRSTGFAGRSTDCWPPTRTEIDATVKNIESSTASLEDCHARTCRRAKAWPGMCLKNEQLRPMCRRSSSNLSITTSNLNRLGLWGILWKQKAPTTEAPPPATADRAQAIAY